jgi:hypothetical protein
VQTTHIDDEEIISYETEPFRRLYSTSNKSRHTVQEKANLPSITDVKDTITQSVTPGHDPSVVSLTPAIPKSLNSAAVKTNGGLSEEVCSKLSSSERTGCSSFLGAMVVKKGSRRRGKVEKEIDARLTSGTLSIPHL